MNQKILLIHTDGYDIDITTFDNPAAAQQAMQNAYNNLKPSELAPEWAELSYCDDNDAKLYCNGENVHIWKLHKVYYLK